MQTTRGNTPTGSSLGVRSHIPGGNTSTDRTIIYPETPFDSLDYKFCSARQILQHKSRSKDTAALPTADAFFDLEVVVASVCPSALARSEIRVLSFDRTGTPFPTGALARDCICFGIPTMPESLVL